MTILAGINSVADTPTWAFYFMAAWIIYFWCFMLWVFRDTKKGQQ